jgi:uncharacterized protein YecT (DUF1311 family)
MACFTSFSFRFWVATLAGLAVISMAADSSEIKPKKPKKPKADAKSINCSSIQTEVEKQICGNEKLKALELQLNEAYDRAKAMHPCDLSDLKRERNEWFEFRDREFKDGTGLAEFMGNRIRKLGARPRPLYEGADRIDLSFAKFDFFQKNLGDEKNLNLVPGRTGCLGYVLLKDLPNKAVMDSINREIGDELRNSKHFCETEPPSPDDDISNTARPLFLNEDFFTVKFEFYCEALRSVSAVTLNWDLKTGKRLEFKQLFKPDVKIDQVLKLADDPLKYHDLQVSQLDREISFGFTSAGIEIFESEGFAGRSVSINLQSIKDLINPAGPLGRMK